MQIVHKKTDGLSKTEIIDDQEKIKAISKKLVWKECAINQTLRPIEDKVIVKYLSDNNVMVCGYINCRVEK